MNTTKNTYFLSDFHLGIPNYASSLVREKHLVKFLDTIAPTAEAIYIVGDVFDMWYTYTTVVPKGYTRLLGKLAQLSDEGVKLYMFTGNHDMWLFDYFETELGIKTYTAPITVSINNKQFYIAHGDGLGPGDKGYKFIKKVFANKACQWFFKWLHPDIGLGFANYWSGKSAGVKRQKDSIYLGDDKEFLIQFCNEHAQHNNIDFYVFGHRHYPLVKTIQNKSTYINLGDWISQYTYCVFDGTHCQLKTFDI
ncbi:MAG: UDP-2,3-diacylglucosamine diphosphatase [Bacteroidia bacterium]